MSLVDKIYIYEVAGSQESQDTWQVRFQVNNSRVPGTFPVKEPQFLHEFNDYVTESAHVLARTRNPRWSFNEHPDLPTWDDAVNAYAENLLSQLPFEIFKTVVGAFSAESNRCIIYVIEENDDERGRRRGHGLHSIKWELLEGLPLGSSFPDNYTVAISRVIDFQRGIRRMPFESLSEIQHNENGTVKILLVVARDLRKGGRDKDADPDLAQIPLMQLQQDLNHWRTRILVEIVRPGSIMNLREHLKNRKKQNFNFNIIHFDMHGHENNTDSGSESRLIFSEGRHIPAEMNNNRDPRGVNAERVLEVARIVEEFRIEHVVLTACWSAYECVGRANNMVQHFLRANVCGVSAVWGRAGTDSVMAYNKAFYRALLGADGHISSFEEAVHAGRKALREETNRWPTQRKYRDDFLYVYYARDSPDRSRNADRRPHSHHSLVRFPSSIQRRRQDYLLSATELPPRLSHLSLELEIYLQTHDIVYANDSSARQPILLRTIESLSQLWLRTNFVRQVLFYDIDLDTHWPQQGPHPSEKKTRENHGYLIGHRLPEAIRESVHVFQGLDHVLRGNSTTRRAVQETMIRKIRQFLVRMNRRDYAIILGCNTELNWMPRAWANDLGRSVKYWSHGNSVYVDPEDQPDPLNDAADCYGFNEYVL